jgi:Na+/H+ antiporter NhaD/arsenite permease-like protein
MKLDLLTNATVVDDANRFVSNHNNGDNSDNEKQKHLPLWWALALGADLGGNGTLIGSSAGVVAAGLAEKLGHPITFNRWFKIGFPFMLITLAIGTVVLPILLIFVVGK